MGRLTSAIIRLTQEVKHQIERMRARKRIKTSVSTTREIGKKEIFRLLGDSPVIFEVGAHKGMDTIEFLILFPRGQVWAFEAELQNFRRLVERVQDFDNVNLVMAAVSDTAGVSLFHQSSGHNDASGSLLHPSAAMQELYPSMHFDQEKTSAVPTVKLDDFVKVADVDHIDFLWMDIQGAELMALRGGQQIIEHTHFIYLEVCLTSLYSGSPSYEEISSYLRQKGFKVAREFLPDNTYGNVLFENVKWSQ